MAKIYRVIQINLNQRLFNKMSIWSLTYQRSVFKRCQSDKHFSEFLPTRWRQKSTATKLRQCHSMYSPSTLLLFKPAWWTLSLSPSILYSFLVSLCLKLRLYGLFSLSLTRLTLKHPLMWAITLISKASFTSHKLNWTKLNCQTYFDCVRVFQRERSRDANYM